MGILKRFVRICKADIHGVMDQMEDKELLLRQYLREMEGEITRQETELSGLEKEREHLLEEVDHAKCDMEKLEEDIRIALEKERDDIAGYLIRKLSFRKAGREKAEHLLSLMNIKIGRIEETLSTRKQRFDHIRTQARTFFLELSHRKLTGEQDSVFEPGLCYVTSDKEVELELLRRKESLSGAQKGGEFA